jgi:hypothetical protein
MDRSVTKETAILGIKKYFESNDFYNHFARSVAVKTDSHESECKRDRYIYLNDEIIPFLDEMGFSCETLPNRVDYGGPFLIAEDFEGEGLPFGIQTARPSGYDFSLCRSHIPLRSIWRAT